MLSQLRQKFLRSFRNVLIQRSFTVYHLTSYIHKMNIIRMDMGII